MDIYLDLVWLLNFLLDMLLLMLTQILLRENISKKRIMLGAAVASMIVPITLYFPNSILNTLIGKLIYSFVIILCTFGYQSIYLTFRRLFLFYFVSFAIGGGLLAVHFLLQKPLFYPSNQFLTFTSSYGDPISWIFVVIGFPVAWYFTKRRMDKHVEGKIRYDQFYPVTLVMKGKSYTTNGYIDSGNQLVDPLSKKLVVVCAESFLKQWFTDEEWNSLKEANEHLDIEGLPDKWKNVIQIIPFQGVGGNHNFLLALQPEKLIIQYEDERIVTSKILVGVQFGELTRDQSYHCLLHPQIIKIAAVQTA